MFRLSRLLGPINMPRAMKNPVQHVMQIVYLHENDITSLSSSITLDIDLKSIMVLTGARPCIRDQGCHRWKKLNCPYIMRDEIFFYKILRLNMKIINFNLFIISNCCVLIIVAYYYIYILYLILFLFNFSL